MWREYFGPKAHIYGVDVDRLTGGLGHQLGHAIPIQGGVTHSNRFNRRAAARGQQRRGQQRRGQQRKKGPVESIDE